jgi:hypothetical protein
MCEGIVTTTSQHRRRRPSRTRPRDLGDVAALAWRAPRLRLIPLEAIVGTVDAAIEFDAGFGPASDRVASRWESIARAHREGRPLQPILLARDHNPTPTRRDP